MGVIQILNKKVGTGRFSEEEVRFAQDIAEVLGIAFFNQERLAKRRKTRFGYLIARGLITESDLDLAWDEVRATKKTIENVLMEKYGVTKEDIGKSYEDFFGVPLFTLTTKLIFPVTS